MKLTYFKAPVRVAEGSLWFHAPGGFWRTPIKQMRCSRWLPQEGLDKAGRRKRKRMCSRGATYASYHGHEIGWLDPLCTQHFKTATPGSPS